MAGFVACGFGALAVCASDFGLEHTDATIRARRTSGLVEWNRGKVALVRYECFGTLTIALRGWLARQNPFTTEDTEGRRGKTNSRLLTMGRRNDKRWGIVLEQEKSSDGRSFSDERGSSLRSE